MAQLVLRGHATRGKKVIDLLETLGANRLGYNDSFVGFYYYIECGAICSSDVCPIYSTVFTLEKFLEKYPYKVGDKVIYDNSVHEIIDMKWNDNINTISYGVSNKTKNLAIVEELQPYKEETMEEKNGTTEITIEYYFNEGSRDKILRIPNNQEIVIENGIYILRNKKPQYPKTYDECCKVVNASPYVKLNYNTSKGQKYSYDVDNLQLYENIRKLKICRDAYWKIAGDWQPDWEDESEIYDTISYDGVNIKCYNNTDVYSKLAFPTTEMRDAFYENFKELIEECKELL